jgi:hypothetical protein
MPPRYGQIEPSEAAAATPPPTAMGPVLWFIIAVGAGVTVWWITKQLDRPSPRRPRHPVHIEEE